MYVHCRHRKLAIICLLWAVGLGVTGNHASGQGRREGRRERPPRTEKDRAGERSGRPGPQRYSIEQAVSDGAQLHTISFSGLAFITGDFGAATFMPPGKVCDFFGFQYMRDIDAAGKGHNPMFLNRAAGNVLHVLTDGQRNTLADLAREQAPQLTDLAVKRLPLIKAFYRELAGDVPAGSEGLNKDAVIWYVGDVFAFDAELSYRRAQVLGQIASSLTSEQRDYLATMKFGDFSTWPDIEAGRYRMPRGTDRMVNVAYMTYASEFFSWYAGSPEVDAYFCPERHGTYFGGFYMKDVPAMGKRDYDISTSLTGDSGREFLNVLTEDQRRHITAIPDLQRTVLGEIVDMRRAIVVELRKLLHGEPADRGKVIALGRRYGCLDGEMSYCCALAFTRVSRTLSQQQRDALARLRNLDGYTSAPAYLYSTPIQEGVRLPDTDPFFFPPGTTAGDLK